MSLIRRRMMMSMAKKSSGSLPDYSAYRGVYIEDVDGYLYTESEWDGSKTPNGIAVLTDNCRFVIALANAYSSSCRWGGYGTQVSGIVTTMSSSTAATDYAGEANTTTIINALNGTNDGYVDGAPAAEYCRAYTFPNGATGYMGSAGEWKAALDNKAAIASALSKCGGTAMSNYYWTSTQASSHYSWYVTWLNEYLAYDLKSGNYYVRAFASLKSDEQESGGGGDSGLEFPIYLEFDSCEALDKWITTCVRNPDEISIKLRDYFVQIAIEYGSNANGTITVTEQELDLLGVEVYIDSQKVSYYTYNGNVIMLYMQSVYDNILFREDCTLYFEGML